MKQVSRALTLRQRGLIACLLDGLSASEAAAALGVSAKTERADMRRICQVLGARNRLHAAALVGEQNAQQDPF